MSAHNPCTCPGSRKERMRNWVVTSYKARCSAFDGYRMCYSDYSQVFCGGPGEHGTGCLGLWRTRSSYADNLPRHKGPATREALRRTLEWARQAPMLAAKLRGERGR